MKSINEEIIDEISKFVDDYDKLNDKYCNEVDKFFDSTKKDFTKLWILANPYKALSECSKKYELLSKTIYEIKKFLKNNVDYLNDTYKNSSNYEVYLRHFQNAERILLTIQNLQVKIAQKSSQISLQLSIRNSRIATFFFIFSIFATIITSFFSFGKSKTNNKEEIIINKDDYIILIDSQKYFNSRIKELDEIIHKQKVSIDSMAFKIDSLKKANKKK